MERPPENDRGPEPKVVYRRLKQPNQVSCTNQPRALLVIKIPRRAPRRYFGGDRRTVAFVTQGLRSRETKARRPGAAGPGSPPEGKPRPRRARARTSFKLHG